MEIDIRSNRAWGRWQSQTLTSFEHSWRSLTKGKGVPLVLHLELYGNAPAGTCQKSILWNAGEGSTQGRGSLRALGNRLSWMQQGAGCGVPLTLWLPGTGEACLLQEGGLRSFLPWGNQGTKSGSWNQKNPQKNKTQKPSCNVPLAPSTGQTQHVSRHRKNI